MECDEKMVDIIIPGIPTDKQNYDKPDTPKDCSDFIPLNDGTIGGDKKYCDLSFKCKQLGMYSDYVEITDRFGNFTRDYLCTGCHPIFEERSRDEKAS
jgi:hypothetical protein